MRKWTLFLALAVLCIGALAIITWGNRENILAHFMSRKLHVPVSVESLNLNRTSAQISHLWVGNFPNSKTKTSFSAQTLKIEGQIEQILGTPLTIEEIDIDHIFVGIEYFDAKGEDSNWSRILHQEEKKKKKSRDYLIRTLVLRNLTVELTQADGSVKRYPTIKEMEFHNISSESGFPVEEIEKAIFNLMMQDLFKKLQIDQLFKAIRPLPLPFFNPR